MVYIVQISDLHFPDDVSKDGSRYSDIIESVITAVSDAVPKGQRLLIAVCGDLIDQGRPEGFASAKEVIDELKEALGASYKIQFGFVPGNHDVVGGELNEFREFISEYIAPYDGSQAAPCYCIPIEDAGAVTDVIFVNSVDRGAIEKGKIDFSQLSDLLKQLDASTSKILVLHHTILSMDENDKSSILNAARLVGLIERYHISLLLHGHTHGLDTISIGTKNCAIVGVGALFSRNYSDVNSQFNLLQYQSGVVNLIRNYTYHQDRAQAPEKMVSTDLSIPGKNGKYVFSGSRISDAYADLISTLAYQKRLYNICICGKYKFSDFQKDVETSFGRKKDFDFDYSTLAENWQSDSCPQILYFSHGQQYYNQERKEPGISYIIDTLKTKPTSSRAVLSTISMKDIDGTEDYFLPSLMVIQFGFDSQNTDTLMITIYLRALEASRFLKINICEILHLAKQVRKQLPFEYLDVNINAFRVQIEEEFSCFIKSELDRLATDELQKRDIQEYVRCKDYKKIISLLEGKYKHTETVVVSQGIDELIKSIEWVNSRTELEHYNPNILDYMKGISKALLRIEEKRKNTSNYDDPELDKLKEDVRRQIQKTIELFRSVL